MKLKKNKFNYKIWVSLIGALVLCFPLGFIATIFILVMSGDATDWIKNGTFNKIWDKKLILSISTLVLFLILLLGFLFYFFLYKTKNNKFVKKSKLETFGNAKWDINDLENPHDKNDEFNKYGKDNWTTPSFIFRSDIPEGSKIPKIYGIDVKKAIHGIVTGKSGAGKTWRTFIPMAIKNARIADPAKKPAMFFLDPKGELRSKLSGEFEENGYGPSLVLNFRDPQSSSIWNPLENIYNYWKKSLTWETNIQQIFYLTKPLLENELMQQNENGLQCLIHKSFGCKECIDRYFECNKRNSNGYELKQYYDTYFINDEQVNNFVAIHKNKIRNEAVDEIEDIVQTLVPAMDNDPNANFYSTAQGLLKGVILAMLQIIEHDVNEIPLSRFNMVSVMKICNNVKYLQKWFLKFAERFPMSDAWTAASKVINQGDKQIGIYTGIVSDKLKLFENNSLWKMLCTPEKGSETEKDKLDLFGFVNKQEPRALFLIVPDEKADKDPLVSLFISQFYKTNIFLANENKIKNGKEELDREMIFFLDEFGNMPMIKNFDRMLNVSRSRKMHFYLGVQNFDQIGQKYGGEKMQNIILGAMGLKIYINSDSINDFKYISELCGEQTVETKSISGKSDKDSEASASLTSIPLINTTKLSNISTDYSVNICSFANPSIVRLHGIWDMMDYLGLDKKYTSIESIVPFDSGRHLYDLTQYDIDKFDEEPNFQIEEAMDSDNLEIDETGYITDVSNFKEVTNLDSFNDYDPNDYIESVNKQIDDLEKEKQIREQIYSLSKSTDRMTSFEKEQLEDLYSELRILTRKKRKFQII